MDAALKPRHSTPAPLLIVRWLARIASLASIAMLAVFATSGGNFPTAGEWLLIAFFPVGVVVGMIVAWWREIAGGIITLLSLVAFYITLLITSGHAPTTPWFVVFASPGLLLLLCGLLAAHSKPRT
jgi:hypothetical protein